MVKIIYKPKKASMAIILAFLGNCVDVKEYFYTTFMHVSMAIPYESFNLYREDVQ